MDLLKDFMNTLEFGDPQTFGSLTIKPLVSKSDYTLPFLTLEEALEQDVIEITEKSLSGDIPELLVVNKGDKDVILIEGEQLHGAKQNRMINTTIVIPADSEMIVPVTCVERGRWRYRSERFSSGKAFLYPSLRMKSIRSVTSSLKNRNDYHSDQGEVWEDISSKCVNLDVENKTEAASDVMKQVVGPVEGPLLEDIKHQEGQVGFLAFIDGGFAGGDLFGSADLCRKKLANLSRGYFTDTADPEAVFPKIDESEVLKEIAASDKTEYDTIGRGREIRFGNGSVQGACKVVDGVVSHLAVFPKD